MKCFKLAVGCLILLTGGGLGQDQPQKEAAVTSPPISNHRAEALQQVVPPLTESSEELDRLRAQLEKADSDEAKNRIQEQIDAETERLNKLRQNFRSIIGGAEAAEYEGAADENLSFENLMVDLLEPLSRAVREASATPRELDVLRESLIRWENRMKKCDVILQRIEILRNVFKRPELESEFESARRFWEGRKAESRGQIGVLTAQIQEREEKQRPMLEMVSNSISSFFKSRGLNLVLAIFFGVLAFFATRKIYDLIRKFSPLHRKSISLASRLMDVAAGLMASLLALWAIMLVFYIRGDWLLLTIAVLFLLGAVWAGKASLPLYFEQVRTLLNLGSIREGERVIHEGLPFRVKSLGFLTTLDNPRLQGGEYRIPVRLVMGYISRLPHDKEPWFPTETNDWVVMADDTYGKVITQTPEQVVLLKLGGSMMTYPSAAFLEGTPENLSHGYRLACVFGIDYQHQKISTAEVPEIFENAVTTKLAEKFGKEEIRSVKAEFKQAGASSLDYQINVDVSSELDSRFHVLERLVQKVCVDVCNEQGWVIPFTQITVHQADPA